MVIQLLDALQHTLAVFSEISGLLRNTLEMVTVERPSPRAMSFIVTVMARSIAPKRAIDSRGSNFATRL